MTQTDSLARCECSPTRGACDEHKAQNALVSSVAEAVSEADEVAAAAEAGLPAMLKHLEAVSVDDHFAWMASQQGPWVTATAEQIKTCCWRQPAFAQGERWLEWPDGGNASVVMPSWWSPEQREALRCACGQIDALDAGLGCTRCDMESLSQRITADLTTGEEVAL